MAVQCPHEKCGKRVSASNLSKHYQKPHSGCCTPQLPCPGFKAKLEGNASKQHANKAERRASSNAQSLALSHASSPASSSSSSSCTPTHQLIVRDRALTHHTVAKWNPTHEELEFYTTYLALHPPTSIEQAVCTAMPSRILVVNSWLGSVFGSLRIASWTRASAIAAPAIVGPSSSSSASVAVAAALPVPASIVLRFYYDTTVHNCVRRLWDGTGSLAGFLRVMARWLTPLLQRASIFYGQQHSPFLQRSSNCFIGMTILPPCVLTRMTLVHSPPTVVAHLRANRKFTMLMAHLAWSVVCDLASPVNLACTHTWWSFGFVDRALLTALFLLSPTARTSRRCTRPTCDQSAHHFAHELPSRRQHAQR